MNWTILEEEEDTQSNTYMPLICSVIDTFTVEFPEGYEDFFNSTTNEFETELGPAIGIEIPFHDFASFQAILRRNVGRVLGDTSPDTFFDHCDEEYHLDADLQTEIIDEMDIFMNLFIPRLKERFAREKCTLVQHGGVVHGIGQKGKVMDYNDLDLHGSVRIYVVEGNNVIEKTISAKELPFDKKNHYVVKEFLDPPFLMKVKGYTKKTYMDRELEGYKKIKFKGIGIPYRTTDIVGIIAEGNYYTVMRKCKETLTENVMSVPEFHSLVLSILTELVKIQKRNLAHGDIKLDNIMKCKKYQLIDWENSRTLDYDAIWHHRYLGLSPMYFQMLYGPAWYPAFSVALLKYHHETGVHDYDYANAMIAHFTSLFQKKTPKEVFEKTKYTLDVGAFGFILYGAMKRNPALSRYRSFIMKLFTMNAKEALYAFQKKKTRKNNPL
jgi:serine/threonine protein kinase